MLWCAACNLTPTARARHCTLCNKCVEVYDHHCVWVNTCVGRKNHRRFFAYLALQLALVVYAMHCIIRDARLHQRRFWTGAQTLTAATLLLLAGFLVFLAGLAAFHAFLIVSNQTTFELSRYGMRGKGGLSGRSTRRTYSKGCLRNIWLFAANSDDFYYAPGTGEDCLMDSAVCNNAMYSCC